MKRIEDLVAEKKDVDDRRRRLEASLAKASSAIVQGTLTVAVFCSFCIL